MPTVALDRESFEFVRNRARARDLTIAQVMTELVSTVKGRLLALETWTAKQKAAAAKAAKKSAKKVSKSKPVAVRRPSKVEKPPSKRPSKPAPKKTSAKKNPILRTPRTGAALDLDRLIPPAALEAPSKPADTIPAPDATVAP
jgi:hypothetical protein